jgi:hypothetical protein
MKCTQEKDVPRYHFLHKQSDTNGNSRAVRDFAQETSEEHIFQALIKITLIFSIHRYHRHN